MSAKQWSKREREIVSKEAQGFGPNTSHVWSNVFMLDALATLAAVEAERDTEREVRVGLESSQRNLRDIALGGDPLLPVSGDCVTVRDRLAAIEAERDALAKKLVESAKALDRAVGFREGHPSMCCGKCHETLAAANAERDALAAQLAAAVSALRDVLECWPWMAGSGAGLHAAATIADLCAAAEDHDAKVRIEADRERDRAVKLLFDLVVKCYVADVNEDLGDVEYTDAMQALARCPACGGHGTRDGLPHEDEVPTAEDGCKPCGGVGFLPELRRTEGCP